MTKTMKQKEKSRSQKTELVVQKALSFAQQLFSYWPFLRIEMLIVIGTHMLKVPFLERKFSALSKSYGVVLYDFYSFTVKIAINLYYSVFGHFC